MVRYCGSAVLMGRDLPGSWLLFSPSERHVAPSQGHVAPPGPIRGWQTPPPPPPSPPTPPPLFNPLGSKLREYGCSVAVRIRDPNPNPNPNLNRNPNPNSELPRMLCGAPHSHRTCDRESPKPDLNLTLPVSLTLTLTLTLTRSACSSASTWRRLHSFSSCSWCRSP